MSSSTLVIGPRDPLLLRDGRSFNADPGARAFTLPWPLPRTISGAVRTHIGNHAGFTWDRNSQDSENAKKIEVRGPLLTARAPGTADWIIHVAAPLDYVALSPAEDAVPVEKPYMALRPWELDEAAGCDWPKGTAPTGMMPLEVKADGKPDKDAPAFWTIDAAWQWLMAVSATQTDALARPTGGLKALSTEIRTHVAINPVSGTGIDGMLFGTENLIFPDWPVPREKDPVSELAIVAAVEHAPEAFTSTELTFLPLGGERRIATVRNNEPVNLSPLEIPENIDWSTVKGIRLLLVTPALFANGWFPQWLTTEKGPLGAYPFKLVGAATGRPNTISGWDLRGGGMNQTRSAVPAGSVYFYKWNDDPAPSSKERELARQQAFENVWKESWLRPVSDVEQDRHDGFGLVLPGIW